MLSSQKQTKTTEIALLSAGLDPASTQSWVVGGQCTNYPIESQCQDSNARQDHYRTAKWNSLSLQWTDCTFPLYSPEPQFTRSQISYCYYWTDSVISQYLQICICRHTFVSVWALLLCLCGYASPMDPIQKKAGRDRLTFNHASEFWGWQRLQGLSRLPCFFNEKLVTVLVLQLRALTVASLAVSCLSAMLICLFFKA